MAFFLCGCAVFRLSARYFLCSCKESTQRKHAPTVPVAARLPCDARTLRRLRNSHPQSGDCGCSGSARRRPLRALCFSAGPTWAPKRSWPHALVRSSTRKKTKHRCRFFWFLFLAKQEKELAKGEMNCINAERDDSTYRTVSRRPPARTSPPPPDTSIAPPASPPSESSRRGCASSIPPSVPPLRT